MQRRQLLTALAAGSGLLAGCSSDDTSEGGDGKQTTTEPTATTPATPRTTIERRPIATFGLPGTICEETMIENPGIYAITEPAFDSDWSGYEIDDRYVSPGREPLDEDAVVIGLEREGAARAYPLDILWYHEIVNDDFGGPVAVTYCPICRSGMVAERVVDGQETIFAVSGLLWKAPGEFSAASEIEGRVFGAANHPNDPSTVRHSGNLVFYDDATLSYWSQILAESICGPEQGTELTILPSTVALWGEWRAEHPETDVLLPPPHSETRTLNPEVGPGGA